ncbi:MAG: phosphotransferase family protein, partial [Actinobacteria bacterium]|nr:phosphotransferase family protein [Actinomycetota bacterium]
MADTEAGAESATGDIEGINVPRVTDWLVANVEGVQPPFSFELIAGGRSNLTFRVTDAAGRDLVLR